MESQATGRVAIHLPICEVEVGMETVDPASALPKIVGLTLLDGDAGVEPSPVGADGAI